MSFYRKIPSNWGVPFSLVDGSKSCNTIDEYYIRLSEDRMKVIEGHFIIFCRPPQRWEQESSKSKLSWCSSPTLSEQSDTTGSYPEVDLIQWKPSCMEAAVLILVFLFDLLGQPVYWEHDITAWVGDPHLPLTWILSKHWAPIKDNCRSWITDTNQSPLESFTIQGS